MAMMFEFAEDFAEIARIKVAGIGGAGGNAVNRMIQAGLRGVEFLAVNTDIQALRMSDAHQKIQIGARITRGLGSGGDPRIGRKAVEEDEGLLTDALHGSDMVFVTGGMGGGTGTGAAPVIARIARELGALTVGIVTKPFLFEGAVRLRQAEEGVAALRQSVDTLIVIPNERLLKVVPPTTSMTDAFRFADNILYEATRGIYEIIARPNLVNLDFADVRSVMANMGVALMGTGRGSGENRASAAARAAISSPLLEDVDIHGARGVLVNITGADLGIAEVSEAMSLIQDAAGAQAHIIFGYGIDETLGDTLQVTVVATGFDGARTADRPATRGAALVAAGPRDEQPAASPGPAGSAAPSTRELLAAQLGALEAELGLDFSGERAVAGMAPEAEAPRLAAAGGADEPILVEEQSELSAFLSPAGPDSLPLEALTPAASAGPPPPASRRGSPFRSDALMADLNEPAYTRKYLD